MTVAPPTKTVPASSSSRNRSERLRAAGGGRRETAKATGRSIRYAASAQVGYALSMKYHLVEKLQRVAEQVEP